MFATTGKSSAKGTPLTPGSLARIYRDGGVPAGQVNVPEKGNLEIRNLPPGQYVARDECGGEIAFEVTVHEEVCSVPLAGALSLRKAKNEDVRTDGQAGSSVVTELEESHRVQPGDDEGAWAEGALNEDGETPAQVVARQEQEAADAEKAEAEERREREAHERETR